MTPFIDEDDLALVNFCGVLGPFEEELAGDRVVIAPCALEAIPHRQQRHKLHAGHGIDEPAVGGWSDSWAHWGGRRNR